MALCGIAETKDVVEIDQGKLTAHGGQYNVPDSLKCGRGVIESERHAQKALYTEMRRECHEVAVRSVQMNLAVAQVCVQLRKYCRVAERVYTLLHSWDRIRVPNGHRVKITVVG